MNFVFTMGSLCDWCWVWKVQGQIQHPINLYRRTRRSKGSRQVLVAIKRATPKCTLPFEFFVNNKQTRLTYLSSLIWLYICVTFTQLIHIHRTMRYRHNLQSLPKWNTKLTRELDMSQHWEPLSFLHFGWHNLSNSINWTKNIIKTDFCEVWILYLMTHCQT